MSGTTTKSGSSFERCRIDVTFKKAGGAPFKGTNTNTVTLSGLRVSASISQAGGATMGSLDMRVFGMTQTMMNELTFAGPYLEVEGGGGTVVTVQAGTASTGLSMVFQGVVATAMAVYTSAPQVPFHVTALAGLGLAMDAVPGVSYPGSVDAAVVMGDLARASGRGLENNGVTGIVLSNPHYHGSPLDQMRDCAKEAGIEMAIVDEQHVIIWPKGKARGGLIPLVSPDTGLVGYPIKTPLGVNFITRFNPAIRPFATVQLETSLPFCKGKWNISLMDYNLESETPGGEWFTTATCQTPLDFTPAAPETVAPTPAPAKS